jgi:hypothetical protein
MNSTGEHGKDNQRIVEVGKRFIDLRESYSARGNIRIPGNLGSVELLLIQSFLIPEPGKSDQANQRNNQDV